MSQHISILSPGRIVSPGKPASFIADDDENISSLQALINILRKPREMGCPACQGRGAMRDCSSCEYCHGAGKRLFTSTSRG